MTRFWGVFLDETRCEFGAPIEAKTKEEAWRIAAEDYPESKCVQLESPEDTKDREMRIYRAAEIDSGYLDDDVDYDDDEDDYDSTVPDDAYDLKDEDNYAPRREKDDY